MLPYAIQRTEAVLNRSGLKLDIRWLMSACSVVAFLEVVVSKLSRRFFWIGPFESKMCLSFKWRI
jgi:hypothetical protein